MFKINGLAGQGKSLEALGVDMDGVTVTQTTVTWSNKTPAEAHAEIVAAMSRWTGDRMGGTYKLVQAVRRRVAALDK